MYVKKICEINLHSHLKEIQHTSDSQSITCIIAVRHYVTPQFRRQTVHLAVGLAGKLIISTPLTHKQTHVAKQLIIFTQRSHT